MMNTQHLAQDLVALLASAIATGALSADDAGAPPGFAPVWADLLAALQGRAPGQDSGIGVFEIFSYLRLHVPPDAATITYQGAPLVQEPLFYASQLDDNIAVALRQPGVGGTLGAATPPLARLIELELQLEAQGAAMSPALITARDTLLDQLARLG
jgi:hypothetical protein